MQRDAHSHKGDNGKVAVIGGSRHMHGAPLFSGLAAEATGIDLLMLCVPACHEEVAKQVTLNGQVYPFRGNDLLPADREPILELLATMDCAVIGPGIARSPVSLRTLRDILAEATCNLVVDASALQPDTLQQIRGKYAVLTPHLGELERMELTQEDLPRAAGEAGAVILLKGPVDIITSPDGTQQEVHGGNAGLTVGGTGDALAGLIAGLIAQREDRAEACRHASTIIKRAGDDLLKEKGYTYTTADVIARIPHLLAADA